MTCVLFISAVGGAVPFLGPTMRSFMTGNFRLQESELVEEKIANTFIWIIRDIKTNGFIDVYCILAIDITPAGERQMFVTSHIKLF